MEKESGREDELRERLDAFEPGCRLMQKNLHEALERANRRFGRSFAILNRLVAKMNSDMMILNRQIVDDSGLLKVNNRTRIVDHSALFAIFEKLGTPEALAYIRSLRTLEPTLKETVWRRRSGHNPLSHSSTKIFDEARKKTAQEDDPGLSNGIRVWKQLLQDGKYGSFLPKAREDYIRRCEALEALGRDCEAMGIRLDTTAHRLDSAFDCEDALELLVRNYNRRIAAIGRLRDASLALDGLDTAPPPEIRSPRIPSPLNARLRQLEEEQETNRIALQPGETILREHFASRPDLIAPVAGVMKEIQFLCREVVKFRIEDVTAWEIGIASQKWPSVKEKLPRGSTLSAVDPAAVEEALKFLNEHEDFLAAYNTVRKGRERAGSITNEIRDIRKELAKPVETTKKSTGAEDLQIKKARLARAVKVARDEVDSIGEKLVSGLEALGELKTPEEFLRERWIKAGGDRIGPTTEELDDIDSTMQALLDGSKKSDSGV